MQSDALKRWARLGWRPAAGIAGLAALVAWSGGACAHKVEPGRDASPGGRPVPAAAGLYTARVERVAARVGVIGTVESVAQVRVSARLGGAVLAVHASAGDRVRAGQLLAELDGREIAEQLAGAEARLKQAEAEYQRTRQLFEKNAATDQALLAAETGRAAAGAAVEGAKVMQTYTRIAAPLDGIVTERRIEAGDLAAPGQVLLSVYDPLRMRLEALVPLRLVDKLGMNQAVSVSLDRPAAQVEGRVTEIVSEVDPASRTQKVKIELRVAGADVLPGTFGRLWLDDEPHDALLVPAGAVYRAGQLEVVQVAEGGRAFRRLVRTGPACGARVEILSGLSDGDVVLTAPNREG